MSPEDLPSGIAPIGPNPPELDLRGHLAAALTAAGFGEVCLDEDRPATAPVGPKWGGALISLTLTASAVLAIHFQADIGWSVTLVAALVIWIAVLVLGQKMVSLLLLFGAWIAIGALLWVTHGFLRIFESYFIPLSLALAVYCILRARRSRLGVDLRGLLRSMPLLFPLVLLLLFVPLVTQDLWRVAVTIGTVRLASLAVLTVLPLTLVFGSKLVGSLPEVIAETGSTIALRGESISEVQHLIERHRGRYAGSWVLNHGRTMVQQGYGASCVTEYAPFLTAVVRRPLARALALRTVVMLIGLGVAVFLYLYALAVIMVDSAVAREWSKEAVSTGHVHLLGVGLSLLGGPYIAIAALLGIVALGAFLALLTVDESYSRAMAGALVNEPVKDYLLLALPYVRLRERQILGEAPTSESGPLRSPPDS